MDFLKTELEKRVAFLAEANGIDEQISDHESAIEELKAKKAAFGDVEKVKAEIAEIEGIISALAHDVPVVNDEPEETADTAEQDIVSDEAAPTVLDSDLN